MRVPKSYTAASDNVLNLSQYDGRGAPFIPVETTHRGSGVESHT